MLETHLISADSGQERGNVGASRKLSSAELFDGLYTMLAGCHDAHIMFSLDDEHTKVLDSSSNT